MAENESSGTGKDTDKSGNAGSNANAGKTGTASDIAKPDSKGDASETDTNPVIVVGSQPGEEVQIVSSDTKAVTELPLAPAQKAGYKLAIFILIIISAYLVILGGILIFKTFDASDKISLSSATVPDSTFQHQKDLIKSLQEEKKNSRDFIIQISQMVLLNLLLPTLTAILGYIFGSREGSGLKKTDT